MHPSFHTYEHTSALHGQEPGRHTFKIKRKKEKHTSALQGREGGGNTRNTFKVNFSGSKHCIAVTLIRQLTAVGQTAVGTFTDSHGLGNF
jgi:hypothetical protein